MSESDITVNTTEGLALIVMLSQLRERMPTESRPATPLRFAPDYEQNGVAVRSTRVLHHSSPFAYVRQEVLDNGHLGKYYYVTRVRDGFVHCVKGLANVEHVLFNNEADAI